MHLKHTMSSVTIELPDSLRADRSAGGEGGLFDQPVLASAAGEKLAVVLTMDYLRREAAQGHRADFEKYLAAVPDVPAPDDDRLED